MRPFLGLIALALAVPLLAQDKEEEVVEIEEVSSKPIGRLSLGERDQPALLVRLADEGALQIKRGEEWEVATLKDVGQALAGELQRLGDEGYEKLEGGQKVSKLFLSIEADPVAPWQHLQWLMIVAAEQKYHKLELIDGTRRMLTYLPCDRGLSPKAKKPPKEAFVSVHLMARMERPREWNDGKVFAPMTVVYRLVERETEDLKTLAGWIREAKRAVEPELKKGWTLVGEIKAGHKVPFAHVFDVMAAFVDGGIPAVSFYGTTSPTDEVRRLERLPYPAKNY